MKYITLTILLIFALYAPAWGATHTVNQTGGGADYSVAQFNALTGTGYAGDTFYFSGTITTAVRPDISGTSGNYVTLDGWQGGTCDPVDSACSSQAVIDTNGSKGIYIVNEDYLVIQDFEVTDFEDDGGIVGWNGCNYVTVRRCTIHDGVNRGVAFLCTGSNPHNTYITVGGADGDGNKIYNIGYNTAGNDVGFSKSEDLIVSYNHLYGSATKGIDGVATEWASNLLIEYNEIHDHSHSKGEDGIDLKFSTHDVIIRYNHIYNQPEQSGITVQLTSHDVYIYGNSIHDNYWPGIFILEGYQDVGGAYNVYVWSNIIYHNKNDGIYVYDKGTDVSIYNNVFYDNGYDAATSEKAGIRIMSGDDYYIRNNIFYNNHESGSNSQNLYIGSGQTSDTTVTKNIFYDSSETAEVYWGSSGSVTASTIGTDNTVENPDFTAVGSDDFTLTAESPAINNGTDLSGLVGSVSIQGSTYNMYWDDVLDPVNTDWSTTPPTVNILKQDDQGAGWEQGAYAYTGGVAPENNAPIISTTLPSNTDLFADGGGGWNVVACSATFDDPDGDAIQSIEWYLEMCTVDGDMESDPANTWTANNSTIAEEAGTKHGGAKSLKIPDQGT